jgi:hypothetical protein
VKSKQKSENPNKKPVKSKQIKKQIFCLDFPDFRTNLGNPNKKQFFIVWIPPILCMGFPDFSLDFAFFIIGFRLLIFLLFGFSEFRFGFSICSVMID